MKRQKHQSRIYDIIIEGEKLRPNLHLLYFYIDNEYTITNLKVRYLQYINSKKANNINLIDIIGFFYAQTKQPLLN